MPSRFEFVALGQERLDMLVAREVGVTRSQARRLIEEECVFVNGAQQLKAGYGLREGERIEVIVPDAAEPIAKPENIPIDIIYEDADIAVVDKPRGLVVHPAPGNESGTMVNALLFHLGGLSGIGGEMRPGIVHRLDKDTSGLIVVAKNDAAHASLSEQLKNRTCKRTYWALVWGRPKWDEKTVDAPIGRHKTDRKRMAVIQGGREAVTDFCVLARFSENALVEANLHTGRTHQIRVHLASIGFPVAGDPVYGPNKQGFGQQQMLHAKRLKLVHPTSGEEMAFESPLPEDFEKALAKLGMNTSDYIAGRSPTT